MAHLIQVVLLCFVYQKSLAVEYKMISVHKHEEYMEKISQSHIATHPLNKL